MMSDLYVVAMAVTGKKTRTAEITWRKKTPGDLENEGVTEGTQKGYRHGCYGCMPMRNQSHHHSEHHYRANERERERQGGKDGEWELEM